LSRRYQLHPAYVPTRCPKTLKKTHTTKKENKEKKDMPW
jgi:hypothetical protein